MMNGTTRCFKGKESFGGGKATPKSSLRAEMRGTELQEGRRAFGGDGPVFCAEQDGMGNEDSSGGNITTW
jgi:hypothetical protein